MFNNALPWKFFSPLTLETLPKPDSYYAAPFRGIVNGNGNVAVLGANDTFVGFIKCDFDEELQKRTIEAIAEKFKSTGS
jgi:hypothetical protein